MGKVRYQEMGSVRLTPATHERVKILAVRRKQSLASLAEELIAPAVAAEEKRVDRLRADAKKATRVPSPD
jgi:predicted transcriptional regulator